MIKINKENTFGVPISRGGWAGNFIYGTHPGSSISFVSAVGTESKMVGYGNNRADYSFIAGGIIPGVLILPPDFPEKKQGWPFLVGRE